MFSVTYTGINLRPLWTWNVLPTNSGVIVDADIETGLAKNIEYFIYGGVLKNSN